MSGVETSKGTCSAKGAPLSILTLLGRPHGVYVVSRVISFGCKCEYKKNRTLEFFLFLAVNASTKNYIGGYAKTR